MSKLLTTKQKCKRCSYDNSLLPNFEKAMEIQSDLIAKAYEPDDNIPRLWKVQFSISGTQLMELLYRFGQPIR